MRVLRPGTARWSAGGLEQCTPDRRGIDADILEQAVRECVFDLHHPEQQPGRIDGRSLSSVGVLTGVLERPLDARGDSHSAGEQGHASAAWPPPRLPRLMNPSPAEPLDRVAPKRLSTAARTASRSIPIVLSSSASRGGGTPSRPSSVAVKASDVAGRSAETASGSRSRWSYQSDEEVLGADVVVAEATGLRHSGVEHADRVVVQRSNGDMSSPAPSAHVVLLVDRLPSDAERLGDCLPRPAQAAGVVDVQLLELLDKLAQGCHRP